VFQPVFVQDELETTCNDGSSVAYQDTISSSSVGRVRSAASEADDRFECLYVLSITVGLRMGEALGLKWSDIDLDARTLRVSRQLQRMRGGGLVFSEPKNASRRTVDLPQRALEALRRHRKEQMEEHSLGQAPTGKITGLCSRPAKARHSMLRTSLTATSSPCSSGRGCQTYGGTISGTPTLPCSLPEAPIPPTCRSLSVTHRCN
jgi:transposase-like protein